MRSKWQQRMWLAAIALAVLTVACATSAARQNAPVEVSSSQAQTRGQTIDHLIPRRDSIGSAPTTFSWTPIQGADSYSLGVWNEVDQLLWRQNNIPTTSVLRPEEVRLEAGTYFWSISALREGQQVAESGLAAFVVRTAP